MLFAVFAPRVVLQEHWTPILLLMFRCTLFAEVFSR
jgi:hypothetical protein